MRLLSHRSSKMMHMLCLLAVAICLLPEPIASRRACHYIRSTLRGLQLTTSMIVRVTIGHNVYVQYAATVSLKLYICPNFKMLARSTHRELRIHPVQCHAESAEKSSLSLAILFKAAIGQSHITRRSLPVFKGMATGTQHVFYQSVFSASLQSSIYFRVQYIRGICRYSSKMMHTLCLLAMAICLLPEPIASQSLSFHPIYSQGSTAHNQYDRQSGEGWYWVHDPTTDCAKKSYLYPNGHPICGEGVWMRIGFFDMNKTLSECPSPLQMFVEDGRKYCRRASSGCTSVYFDSRNHKYTEVCGMVEAYQYGSMDAFDSSSTLSSIDSSSHLEGISITHKDPRQHLWSYVVGDVANPTSSRSDSCPCTVQGTTSDVPLVIGFDYYCSSGNNGTSDLSAVVKSQYPLWRTYGPSCVSGSTCCDNPDQPWFKKKLTQPASEDVEMRWCAGEQPTSEATATTRVELYIRVDNTC